MFYLAKSAASAYNNPGWLILKPNPHWWGIAAGKRPHFSEIVVTLPLLPPPTTFSRSSPATHR